MSSDQTKEGNKGLCNGLYVKGSVEGVPVTFTADTGASRTVLSKRVYAKIEECLRPQLNKSGCLKGAGGMPIQEWGKAEFAFKLGPLEVIQEAIVAEIEDDVLLGFDILMGSHLGPADILLGKHQIILGGHKIPCIQIGRGQNTRKVLIAEDFCIPGNSEALVDVYVERLETDDEDPTADFIVEPNENFKSAYRLMMASTLVNINRTTTCKVRMMNPFFAETVLKQNANVGHAEKIDRVVSIIQDEEYEGEAKNISSVRQVNTATKGNLKSNSPSFKATETDVPEHLKTLFSRSTESMSSPHKSIVAGLLVKYQDTFSKDDWDLGLTNLTEHAIKTGDAPPVKQRPRRVPLAHAEEERKAIEDLLKKGVIRESTSPWASPIVLVKKKSGAIRPCVDYRKVNALVKPDGYPLPRVQDCLDAVAGSKYFSSFDLTSGYFQIPLKEEDIPKSAFCCKFGHYEMTRMPFGLNSAASTFQRTMELALQGLQWVTCLVYIDDIIVYGADFNQHIQRVDEVLHRIQKAGLKLKPDKCNLLQTEVVFLGHVVSQSGVSPDPTNVSKILQWPTPKSPKQVKQFVATGSYYRRFIKNFAKRARPLIELTKKGKEFLWSEACD